MIPRWIDAPCNHLKSGVVVAYLMEMTRCLAIVDGGLVIHD